MITIYTDGACKGNGKTGDSAGGYGVFIRYPDDSTRKIWGGEPATTNNRMELMGAIVALQSAPADVPVQIFTDSNYVKDGITKWIASWKKNDWKKSDKKPVLNQDLWQQLDALTQNRTIDWQWVKGHNGDDGNEMADSLANLGVHSQGDEQQNSPTTDNSGDNFGDNLPPINADDLDNINAQLDYASVSEDDDAPVLLPKKSKKSKKTDRQPIVVEFNEVQNPDYDGDTSRFNPHFVPIIPIAKHQGHPERQLIMDTETTGFDENNGDRIVEVGVIELVGRKFTGQQLHIYINPEKEMDDEVIKVHGISNEFLTDKPIFSEVADKILAFMDGAELIAHNASFDMRFLNMEFEKAGFPNFSKRVKVTDSLAMARQLYRGQRNTLDALVQRLGVGKKDRTFHGALLDSEILAEVYLAMTSGQVSMNIDEEVEVGSGELSFESLSHLANLLTVSVQSQTEDEAWRQAALP